MTEPRRTRRTGSIHDKLQVPTTREIAAALRRLEDMAARLTVHHRNPEKFFVDRSELKAGIGTLAKQLEDAR